jgi:hypothetical protein
VIAKVTPLLQWYDRAFYSLAPVAREEAGRFVESVSALGHASEVRA